MRNLASCLFVEARFDSPVLFAEELQTWHCAEMHHAINEEIFYFCFDKFDIIYVKKFKKNLHPVIFLSDLSCHCLLYASSCFNFFISISEALINISGKL